MTRLTAALVILAAIAAGLVAMLLWDSSTVTTVGGSTVVARDAALIKYLIIAVIAISALIAALAFAARYLPAIPAGGWGVLKLLAMVLVVAALVVLAVIFWDELLALADPKKLANGGKLVAMWAVLILLGAATLIAILSSEMEAKEMFASLGAWVLVFILIGPYVIEHWPGYMEHRRVQQAYAPAAQAAQQPVVLGCNVHKREHLFPATKPLEKFNPNGTCDPQLFTEGHCVYVTQNLSDRTIGPICNRGDGIARDDKGNVIAMPRNIDRAWSAEGRPFVAAIGLWQPRYTSLLDIR